MPKAALTEQQKSDVVQRNNGGQSIASIARDIGWSESVVRRALREHGVGPDRRFISNLKLDLDNDSLIAQDRKEGMSLADIASKWGVSIRTIEERLRIQGVSAGEYCPLTGPPDDQYINLFQDGNSLVAIGAQYGVGHHTVAKWLEDAGIRTRGKREVTDEVRRKLSRVLSAGVRAEIIRLYIQEEKSIEEIEALMGCSHSTISRILHQHNVHVRKPGEGTTMKGDKISRANTGSKRSEETRRKMSRGMARAIASCRGIGPMESSVAESLKRMRVSFEQQKIIELPIVNGIRSFVCDFWIDGQAILEFFGSYVHCDERLYPDGPVCYFQQKSVDKDKIRLAAFEASGMRYSILWEKDFLELGDAAVRSAVDQLKT